MIGRGLVGDPGMLCPGGTDMEALEAFYDELFAVYTDVFGGTRNAMFRLKENWRHLLCKFEGSEKLVIVGPKGCVYLKEGVIIANRHIHLTPEFAQKHSIKDNDYVDVMVEGVKPTKFYDVQIRIRDDFNVEMHIDTDDANACAIKTGDIVKILEK